ncbi:MAG: expansin EXLX1 family cellulose-binding protein [Deltaproteobacteria bacterium]
MRWSFLVLVAACSSTQTMDDQALGADSAGGVACTASFVETPGQGTYYAADGTGNCSFDASPDDLLVAAMNKPDYGDAAFCGACLEVTGPKGTVKVRVVDSCPGCAHGDLDLSPQAFDMIADHAAGRVPITWHEAYCAVSGPIEYHFKDGANAYWTAVQIRNSRYEVSKLEVMQNGAYSEIPRLDYNYFVAASGLGPGPYQFRVTSALAQGTQVLEDSGIALGDNVTRTGANQFPFCGP